MNHDEIAELLSDYHDNELAAGERAAVDRHLATCADCRRELARYRRVDEALLAQSVPPTPAQTAAFRRTMLEQLESPSAVGAFAAWMASPRIAVPAFALALAALIVAMRPSRNGSYAPADALLISQDDGRTYSWLADSDVSTASVFDWRAR
jgi:anti-sigma factor RsiW